MKGEILQELKQRGDYVSGQELCSRLGVSRTAVWKAIHQLKADGYEIEAVQNRGYRIVSVPDILSLPELESIRKTRWLGEKLFYYEETDSTNTMAKKLAEEGAPHGSVVTADTQTSGRGRRGHQWTSPKGEGIWFTIILKPDIHPEKAAMLTLVMAMAVQKGIERTAELKTRIKWPNDVIVNGKKVCGILTEMSAQIDYVNYIVIGAGINVHTTSFDPELAQKATSLELECNIPLRRAELLETVLEEFEHYYELYLQTKDVSLFQEEYNGVLVNKGRTVNVLDPKGPYEALALGIDKTGELLVERDGSVLKINSGEVSVRGIYGYVS